MGSAMRTLAVNVSLLAAYPSPSVTKPDVIPAPLEIVAATARRHGIPTGYMEEVWMNECSRKLIGERPCRNLKTGERGAFQMKPIAAEHVGCDWKLLGRPGMFAYEAECAARLLAWNEKSCMKVVTPGHTSWTIAQGKYATGRCTANLDYIRKIVQRRIANQG
mgnify:CR=1 FL=1